MKGGKKTNKAIEFLYNFTFDDDFIKDVKEARKLLENQVAFFGFSMHILKKYSIPLAYSQVLQEYIKSGNLETTRTQDEFVAFIDPTAHKTDFEPANAEDYYRINGEPFAKLIILGNNSKTDVMNFIDKNWSKIEDVFLEQGHDINKRVRHKAYKKRDQQIITFSRKKIKELRDELKLNDIEIIGTKYKEDLISKLLKLNKYGNFSVTSGYIRRIISKYKKKKS